MKFYCTIPIDQITPTGEFQTPEALRELAEAVERSKVSGICLSEHPAPSSHWLHNDPTGHDAIDPFVGLALIGAYTKRIKLIASVIVLPYRNPFLTAKSAATVQVFSNDRLVLGIGTGYQKVEFEALGVSFKERGALTDEALETMSAAWAGGSVVKQGRHFNATGNEPRPAPSIAPEIWVGGGSQKAVERAARWGDGWMPFFEVPSDNPELHASAVHSMQDFHDKIARIMELRAEHGRTGRFEIATMTPYYPEGRTESDAERLRESLKVLAEAGVTWMNVNIHAHSRQHYYDELAWLSENIIPHF